MNSICSKHNVRQPNCLICQSNKPISKLEWVLGNLGWMIVPWFMNWWYNHKK